MFAASGDWHLGSFVICSWLNIFNPQIFSMSFRHQQERKPNIVARGSVVLWYPKTLRKMLLCLNKSILVLAYFLFVLWKRDKKEKRIEENIHTVVATPERWCQLRKDYASIRLYLDIFSHAPFYIFPTILQVAREGWLETMSTSSLLRSASSNRAV